MEIVNTYREHLPQMRLIGRVHPGVGSTGPEEFRQYWKNFFHEGGMEAMQKCAPIQEVSVDLVGAMRFFAGGRYEYWIGAFFDPEVEVPDGYESVDTGGFDLGVCWVRGDEKSEELYGMEAAQRVMDTFAQRGWALLPDGWYIERYNHPRFTTPDDEGLVILDICMTLAD